MIYILSYYILINQYILERMTFPEVESPRRCVEGRRREERGGERGEGRERERGRRVKCATHIIECATHSVTILERMAFPRLDVQ